MQQKPLEMAIASTLREGRIQRLQVTMVDEMGMRHELAYTPDQFASVLAKQVCLTTNLNKESHAPD